MQKWEYCVVGPIKSGQVSLGGREPGRSSVEPIWATMTMITEAGGNASKIEKGLDELAKTVAQLGDEGWEMVGCGSVKDTHYLYFKRPKE